MGREEGGISLAQESIVCIVVGDILSWQQGRRGVDEQAQNSCELNKGYLRYPEIPLDLEH
ncbi:MAG TPA: hypothetical protein GXX19_07255 [Syntrophomonadaceae bacterium]|nr:hypothetical protein [Syntrophomonadaceae bacterium]